MELNVAQPSDVPPWRAARHAISKDKRAATLALDKKIEIGVRRDSQCKDAEQTRFQGVAIGIL